ncbi:MAG: PHP domain-containing protein [Spirochaetaceae bacterium]|jgi:PHP family Zn ribbon phosphoesterase|nr:PHP domain-containing protein [Spirochaetaceae bacterium]
MALIADFHNHSCLSPCGSLDLSPRALVSIAAAKGIGVLALTDHNSARNCPAFARLCPRSGIIPLYGLEATTSEEIHVLCLFTALDAALAFGDYAYSILTPLSNDPEKTGDQVWVDEDENIEGEVEYFLPGALDLSVEHIGAKAASFGGIVIPAHVDRPAFSMTSQLGVITAGPWAALECVRVPPAVLPADGGAPFPLDTRGYPLITSSDAHYPEHVGRRPFRLALSAEELLPGGPGTDADMAALAGALLNGAKQR